MNIQSIPRPRFAGSDPAGELSKRPVPAHETPPLLTSGLDYETTLKLANEKVLNRVFFKNEDLPITGEHVMKAVKKTITSRKRNPLRWLVLFPIGLINPAVSPLYTDKKSILKHLPFLSSTNQWSEFSRGVDEALEQLTNVGMLKKTRSNNMENPDFDIWAVR